MIQYLVKWLKEEINTQWRPVNGEYGKTNFEKKSELLLLGAQLILGQFLNGNR